MQQQQQQVGEEEAIRVSVRIRPLQQGEASKGETSCVRVGGDGREVQVRMGPLDAHVYSCNRCFGPETTQENFFAECGLRDLLDSAIGGYRACAFAFGQTGAGKTYCIVGPGSAPRLGDASDGMLGRSLAYLFNKLNSLGVKYTLRLSCLEIYHEHVFDLFSEAPLDRGERQALAVREHATDGFFLEGCRMLACETAKSACAALDIAMRHRQIGEHDLNSRSNRSHTMTDVFIELPGQAAMRSMQGGDSAGQFPGLHGLGAEMASDQEYTVMGRITLVDLAGSENMKKTNSTGKAVQEAGFINKSLYTLGKVISGLTKHAGEGGAKHRDVPFRDSKLTKLLISSLGGKSRTLLMACVTEASGSHAETLRTLKFSVSCARIKNRPVRFLDPQQKLIMDLQGEIRRLRSENEQLRSNLLTAPSPTRSLLRGADRGRDEGASPGLRRASSANPPMRKALRAASRSPERRPKLAALPGSVRDSGGSVSSSSSSAAMKSKSEQVLRNAGIVPTHFKARQLEMIMNRRGQGGLHSRIRGASLEPVREARGAKGSAGGGDKIRELEARIANVEKRALGLLGPLGSAPLGAASSGVLDLVDPDDSPRQDREEDDDDDDENMRIKPSVPKFRVVREADLIDLLTHTPKKARKAGPRGGKKKARAAERGPGLASLSTLDPDRQTAQPSPSVAGRHFDSQWKKDEAGAAGGASGAGRRKDGRRREKEAKEKAGPSPYIYHLVGQPPGRRPAPDKDRGRERDAGAKPKTKTKLSPLHQQHQQQRQQQEDEDRAADRDRRDYEANLADREELRLLKGKMTGGLGGQGATPAHTSSTHANTTHGASSSSSSSSSISSGTAEVYARVRAELSPQAASPGPARSPPAPSPQPSPHSSPKHAHGAAKPSAPAPAPAPEDEDEDEEGYGEDFDDFEAEEEEGGEGGEGEGEEETETDRRIQSRFGGELAAAAGGHAQTEPAAAGPAHKAAPQHAHSPAHSPAPEHDEGSSSTYTSSHTSSHAHHSSTHTHSSSHSNSHTHTTSHAHVDSPAAQPSPPSHPSPQSAPLPSQEPPRRLASPDLPSALGPSPSEQGGYEPSRQTGNDGSSTGGSGSSSSSSSSNSGGGGGGYQPSGYEPSVKPSSSAYQPSSYQPSNNTNTSSSSSGYQPSGSSSSSSYQPSSYQPSSYQPTTAASTSSGYEPSYTPSAYQPTAPSSSTSNSSSNTGNGYQPSNTNTNTNNASSGSGNGSSSASSHDGYQPSIYKTGPTASQRDVLRRLEDEAAESERALLAGIKSQQERERAGAGGGGGGYQPSGYEPSVKPSSSAYQPSSYQPSNNTSSSSSSSSSGYQPSGSSSSYQPSSYKPSSYQPTTSSKPSHASPDDEEDEPYVISTHAQRSLYAPSAPAAKPAASSSSSSSSSSYGTSHAQAKGGRDDDDDWGRGAANKWGAPASSASSNNAPSNSSNNNNAHSSSAAPKASSSLLSMAMGDEDDGQSDYGGYSDVEETELTHDTQPAREAGADRHAKHDGPGSQAAAEEDEYGEKILLTTKSSTIEWESGVGVF